MKSRLDELLEEVKQERLYQQSLPGSEYDLTYGVNDWIAIVIHYLTRDINRKGIAVNQEDYHSNLIKAAAIVIAAAEHEAQLHTKNKQLKKDNGTNQTRPEL